MTCKEEINLNVLFLPQCAECGVDAAGLYRRARSAWMSGDSLAARRNLVAQEMVGTPLEGKVRLRIEEQGKGGRFSGDARHSCCLVFCGEGFCSLMTSAISAVLTVWDVTSKQQVSGGRCSKKCLACIGDVRFFFFAAVCLLPS